MPKVKVAVYARRFIPKTTRTEEFEFSAEVEEKFSTKTSMLNACRKEFGRCVGNLYDDQGAQIGWRFEGKEKVEGSVQWWETKVIPTAGVVQVGRFQFRRE